MQGAEQPRAAIARSLLWLGRVVLLGSSLVIAGCGVGYPRWLVRGDQDWAWQGGLPNATVAAVMMLAASFPLLVLPVGSGALAVLDAGMLRVPTVLGNARVPMAGATVTEFLMPGSHHWRVAVVTAGSIRRWAVVIDSGVWVDVEQPAEFADQPGGRIRRLPAILGMAVLLAWIAASLTVAAVLAAGALRVTLF